MKIDEKLVNAVAKELAAMIFNGKPKRKAAPRKNNSHSIAMRKAWARRKLKAAK